MLALVKKFKQYCKNKKDKKDFKLKKQLCEMAIKEGLCPNFCHHCAWNTKVIKDE